jgi:hypothetical protein
MIALEYYMTIETALHAFEGELFFVEEKIIFAY